MNEVWTVSEIHAGAVRAVSLEMLGRARPLADALHTKVGCVVLGEAEVTPLIHAGADVIYQIPDDRFSPYVTEVHAWALETLVRRYTPQILLSAATTVGRTLMPYLATLLHAGLTADCTELAVEPGTGLLLQTRPAIGGNILATIKTPDQKPQMATVRPGSTPMPRRDAGRTGKVITGEFDPAWAEDGVRVIKSAPGALGPSLEDADIIVSGGLGLKRKQNMEKLRQVAAKVKGAVGCTRELVDRGWADYSEQVGLSGKTVSPRLYLAAGISGAVQHLAGMKTSGHIIAVNTDPEAQIFSVADLGILGSAADVMDALERGLREEER